MNVSNTTWHLQQQQQLFEPGLDVVVKSIYVILSLFGVVCNYIACLLFCKDKTMRKPFNMILFNLSLADMMACLAIQPYVWIDYAFIGAHDKISDFLCVISYGIFFFVSFSAVNIFSLSAVTIHRYLSIVRGYRGWFLTSTTFAKTFCVFTWLIGAAIHIPTAMSHKYNIKESVCRIEWSNGFNARLFSLFVTASFGGVPLLLMIICYVSLIVHIWKRSATASGTNIAAARARKGVTILLGLLIVTFFLGWSPLGLVWILGRALNYFGNGVEGEYERQRWLRISLVFALLNSVIDPFIYVYSSTKYRNGLKMLFCWKEGRRNGVAPREEIALRSL